MSDLKLTHHREQAEAAYAHGEELLRRLTPGTTATWGLPRESERVVLRYLTEWLNSGKLTWCPHSPPTRAAPVFWTKAAPGRFRCWACFSATVHRKTDADPHARCDACGAKVPAIVPVTRIIPPEVVEEPPGAFGPILVIAAYCPACDPSNPETARA